MLWVHLLPMSPVYTMGEGMEHGNQMHVECLTFSPLGGEDFGG